jgi:predicted amidohydrolase
MKIRLAGAQLPVTVDIQANKKEILKAIDWAKENEVNHLLTPEAALSGYMSGWQKNMNEITDALKEIEEHQSKSGLCLHLGTNNKEPDKYGDVFRNQIRHYNPDGVLYGTTFKYYPMPEEGVLAKDSEEPLVPVQLVKSDSTNPDEIPMAVALICNDMWGYGEGGNKSISNKTVDLPRVDVMLHATNGRNYPDHDFRRDVYDSWHDIHFKMTTVNCAIPILTVDSCTPWDATPEDDINEFQTSSQSGFIDFLGWKTNVPRKGRQYFYYDLDVSETTIRKFAKHLLQNNIKLNP